ncbi:hypothetical protein HYALB_00006186 [Hymenoscyphus albidus]|uniref:Uncharacterized protein n=1 Tax=Hymenoscyphus albidus TaxID=595503 RepID=A0A9N9PTA0_9HELO|nr:hypothetical protein HYALB_00006186 [Hymenoscyphus albidus]
MQFLTLPIRILILSATFSAAAALPTQPNAIALQGREPSEFGLQWQEGPGRVHRARSLLDQVSPVAAFAVEARNANAGERAASEVLNRRIVWPGFLGGGSRGVARKQAKAEKKDQKAGEAEIREIQAYESYLASSKSQKESAYKWSLVMEERATELRQKATAAKASAAKAAKKETQRAAKKAAKAARA